MGPLTLFAALFHTAVVALMFAANRGWRGHRRTMSRLCAGCLAGDHGDQRSVQVYALRASAP
jgi:hypothetical protein